MYSLMLHGRRSIELQKKWHNLRILVNLFQNASSFSNSFSSSSSANVSLVVSYLVDSLGLTTKLAESISRKVSFEDRRNPDSILNLFKSHGFTCSQISSIIKESPQLLIVDAEKSLGPKLHFLQSKGASTSEFTEILSKVPKILGLKEGESISIYYDLVKEIIEADKSSKFKMLCHSLPEGSKQENKIRNVLVLRELGVSQKNLFSLLISNFCTLCGKERFEESLKRVVEMGFDPTTSNFVKALNFVYQMSDKVIEEKVNVYKTLGFVEEDVWEMFKKWPFLLGLSEKNILNSIERFLGLGFSRDEFVMMAKRFPACVGYSAETMKKKIEFLVKKMGWPLKAVVSYPAVLGLSLEKRIVPRCNVIKALISKGLLGSELPSVSSALIPTDETFLKRYVRKHDDDKELVIELMAIFTGKQEKKPIKASE